MGHETNIDSIRALEKQIEEDKGDIIKLKRTRNSLLNISTRVPPEILGRIFVWSHVMGALRLVDSWRIVGLRKGSYDFLLVCHHWFEVASRTPELWNFWGKTLQDWKKRYHRCRAAPLDLVLDRSKLNPCGQFDESLQDAIKSRVKQDTIRKVHLMSDDSDTLTSIISSLTPHDEGGRNKNIELIGLRNRGPIPVDISNFFAQSCLPKLRFLDLFGQIQLSSWDHLVTRTTLLTALSLDITPSPSPTLTTTQLLSILTSNPNLQELSLSDTTLPNDVDNSTFRVRLPHLKTLSLTGEPHHLVGLLRRLIFPGVLDEMELTGSGPTVEDMPQTLELYMQDYFRRDVKFQDRLGLSSSYCDDSIAISVDVIDPQATTLMPEPPHVSLTALTDLLPPDALEPLFLNLIALIPRERVVHLDADLEVGVPEELFFMMPNIEGFRISDAELSEGFLQPDPDGPHADKKLLPSLKVLCLQDVILDDDGDGDDDWRPLMTYLAHQTSGGQIISLEMFGDLPYMYPELMDDIKGLVKEFTYQGDLGMGGGE